jgi:hypothetical protein
VERADITSSFGRANKDAILAWMARSSRGLTSRVEIERRRDDIDIGLRHQALKLQRLRLSRA